jgi:glycosyltransferase involved in cell wall biosynthesis
MRFVFVNSARAWGGNEKWTCEAASGLAARGHSTLLVGHSDLMRDKARSYGVDFRYLRLRGDGDLIGITRLSRVFRKFYPDAVVLTKSKEYWLGGLAAKLAGVSRICFRLGIDRPVQRNIKYRLLFGNICDVFIVNAESVKRILLEAPFIGPEKIAVVKNGVSLNGGGGARADAAAGREFRKSLGIAEGSRVIGATGRLAKQKGFDVLIKAFSAVREKFPDTYLVIAGEGHERESLTALIDGLDQSEHVFLPGFVKDMTAFYGGLTILALSSRFEGMPNVLLEAMAAGVPAVATEVSGVGELLEDGVTGRLVPADDTGRLAAALIDALGDEDGRSKMAERARALMEDKYSMDRMLTDLEGVLAGGEEMRQ